MASVLYIPLIFLLATLGLYLFSTNLPGLSEVAGEHYTLRFPGTLEDLRALAEVLRRYRDLHLGVVLLLFASAYLYKQTFAIPGSVFMNLLAGAVFGTMAAFPMCCSLTAFGASNCYLLSRHFGKDLLEKYFSQRLSGLRKKVSENSDGLFFYLLFLRLFPMSPNWFLNMASPILLVPMPLFAASVFVGLMPYNFICVQTGSLLSQISSIDEVFTAKTFLMLLAIAAAALLPALLKSKLQRQKDAPALPTYKKSPSKKERLA